MYKSIAERTQRPKIIINCRQTAATGTGSNKL